MESRNESYRPGSRPKSLAVYFETINLLFKNIHLFLEKNFLAILFTAKLKLIMYLLTYQAAARILQAEAEKWEEENNSIIKVVKLMAHQMAQMADFEKGRGRLKVCLFSAPPLNCSLTILSLNLN